MSLALVGSVGAVTDGASAAAVTPAWGTGQARAAGNLLVVWFATNGSFSWSGTVTGWTGYSLIGGPYSGSGSTGSIDHAVFWKQATGGDAAPTFAGVASVGVSAQAAEFSGYAGSGFQGGFDQEVGNGSNITSPSIISESAHDLGADLVICLGYARYSVAATKTLSLSVNNGATITATTNNATSALGHYAFGYGFTTSPAALTTTTFNFTTQKISTTGMEQVTFTGGPAPRRRAPRPAHYRAPSRGSY